MTKKRHLSVKAYRWWMGVPELLRRLLIAALGVLALSVVLGLAFDGALFAVAPVVWLTMLLFALLHYHSGSKMDAWERAKTEAWDQEQERARGRSSAELHEELERATKRGPMDGRA